MKMFSTSHLVRQLLGRPGTLSFANFDLKFGVFHVYIDLCKGGAIEAKLPKNVRLILYFRTFSILEEKILWCSLIL